MIDPLATGHPWTAESNQDDAFFGQAVGTGGDVNGDGYADVIVGAPEYDKGETDEGRAFAFYGSPMGPSRAPNWTAGGDQAYEDFGESIGSAGDVNGDGYSDVIIGAFGHSNGQGGVGGAFVFYGSAKGLSRAPSWTAEGDQPGDGFGDSVSTAGDVNGDGYDDVIVGATSYDDGEVDEGRAFVYLGSAGGLSTTANWTAESDQTSAYFGNSVATAGDVNGDGYDDVIVGAYFFDNGQTDEGMAYVFEGSASGLATIPSWTAESNQASSFFGYSVATAGDVNGDGYSDVIVGAVYYDHPQTDEGGAFVYQGSATGLSTMPDWTGESNQTSAYFGWSTASGDMNGDGYTDVIVGAISYDHDQTDEGRTLVYRGSASGLSAIPNWKAESYLGSAFFGWATGGGDVDGDGYVDIIVGSPEYGRGQTFEGRAYVYRGSAG